MLTYELPLNEVVLDFYDRLKSVSQGYASLDYHLAGFWDSPMVKMDILVAGEPVDALSLIVHQDFAYERGRALVSKMRRPDSAADVRGRDPGGDRRQSHRARNGWRRSARTFWPSATAAISPANANSWRSKKKARKRMKRIGKVDIPQEAFLALLKVGEEE